MNEQFLAARMRSGLSRRELAALVDQWVNRHRGRRTGIDTVYVGKVERGSVLWPNDAYRAAFRAILGAGTDIALGFRPRGGRQPPEITGSRNGLVYTHGDGIEAMELMQRVEASDVGNVTIEALVCSIEQIARSYTHVAPSEQIPVLLTYQRYLAKLLEGRATLGQRRVLMRQAGWLSLFTATAYMDVGHQAAAAMNITVARSLARETGDEALAAWTLETAAWQAVSHGDSSRAVSLCDAGFAVAPPDSPAYVQLCTQAARASARLGDSSATRQLVDAGLQTAERLPGSRSRESHFDCDRRRVLAHSAAALVWLGDPSKATEELARESVRQYESDDDPPVHHLAMSRLNLALQLARLGQPDEATQVAVVALEAEWRLCSTDLFLAADVHAAVTCRDSGDPDVRAFHERYVEVRAAVSSRGAAAERPAIGAGPPLPQPNRVDDNTVVRPMDPSDPELGRE